MKKPSSFHHFILFNYRGKLHQSGVVTFYRMTVTAMARQFFRIVIDEGFNLAQITDIEFFIDGRTVLGASDGPLLLATFATGQQVGPVKAVQRESGYGFSGSV